MIELAVDKLTPVIGTPSACQALGVAPATIYRRRRPSLVADAGAAARLAKRTVPARTLSVAERDAVRAVLHSERFLDASHGRSGPRCSTRGSTSARSAPRTASCPSGARCVSDAISSCIRRTRNRSSSRRSRSRGGAGI